MTKPIMPGLNRNKIDMGSRGEILGVKYINSFKNVTLANRPLSVWFLNIVKESGKKCSIRLVASIRALIESMLK